MCNSETNKPAFNDQQRWSFIRHKIVLQPFHLLFVFHTSSFHWVFWCIHYIDYLYQWLWGFLGCVINLSYVSYLNKTFLLKAHYKTVRFLDYPQSGFSQFDFATFFFVCFKKYVYILDTSFNSSSYLSHPYFLLWDFEKNMDFPSITLRILPQNVVSMQMKFMDCLVFLTQFTQNWWAESHRIF